MTRRRTSHLKGRAVGVTLYTCGACGEVLRTWAACERHRDDVGHGRFEVLRHSDTVDGPGEAQKRP